MSSQSTYQRIATVNDYKDTDRTIVHFRFTIQGAQFTESIHEAAPSTSPQVVPAKGCVVVLDGCSIGERSLFELSGLRLNAQLEISGKYEAFGYCDKREIDSARQGFFEKARLQALDDHRDLLLQVTLVNRALSLF